MEDWLLRLPRDQILVVRVEDVFGDIPGVMRKVFKFLNLGKTNKHNTESPMMSVVAMNHRNTTKRFITFILTSALVIKESGSDIYLLLLLLRSM